MTTHYMDEAEWCDRIAIMDHGEIVALDAPEALKAGVGTDRVTIHTEDDEAAIAALRERFGIEARIAEGAVTVRRAAGEEFVPRLFAELGVPIRAVSVSRPTLDDVFMSYTGSTIRDAEEDAAKNRNRMMADDGRPSMSMTAQRRSPGAEPAPEIVRVTVPRRSLASELRAVRIVWRRDLIRFANDRIRIVSSLVQPLLFLFVMGSGLQRLSSAGTHGVNLKTFIYPGCPVHLGDVHRDVLGRLDRVGPRVRVPARDAGRAGEPQLDRHRQVPGRRHRGLHARGSS